MKPTQPEKSFIVKNINRNSKFNTRKIRFKPTSLKPSRSINVIRSVKPSLNILSSDTN